MTTGDPPRSSSLKGLCVQGKLITFGGILDGKAINLVHALNLGESQNIAYCLTCLAQAGHVVDCFLCFCRFFGVGGS